MEFHSTEEQIAEHLGLFFDSLKIGDLVLLRGEMGMGKTTFVRAFIEQHFRKNETTSLNEDQNQSQNPSGSSGGSKAKLTLKAVQFSSPSYNLIQEYKLPDYSIYHIDLYRLEDEDQIESVGLWDTLAHERSITFIEWAEKIDENDLPLRPTYEVIITQDEEDHRQYEIKKLER